MFYQKLVGIAALSVSLTAVASSGPRRPIHHPVHHPVRPVHHVKQKTMPVVVPLHEGGWSLGATGFFLQPNNNELSYVLIDDTNDSMLEGNLGRVKPDYQLGFSIHGGYLFHDTGNDFSVHYERLHTKDTKAAVPPSRGELWPGLIHPGSTSDMETLIGADDYADARVQFNYDSLDVLVGQRVKIGNLFLRLSGGARYATLKDKFNFSYKDTNSNSYINGFFDSISQGMGPRLALNGVYKIASGLGFTIAVNTSLLVNEGKIHHMFDQTIEDVVTSPSADVKDRIRHYIVPEIDAKVGLNYTYRTYDGHAFSIDAGWQTINYFNAHPGIRYVDDNIKGTYVHTMSDICFNGPYIGVKASV